MRPIPHITKEQAIELLEFGPCCPCHILAWAVQIDQYLRINHSEYYETIRKKEIKDSWREVLAYLLKKEDGE